MVSELIMNNNIVLNKRQINERLQGFNLQSEKINFLQWQKQNLINLKERIIIEKSKTFYENRMLWLDEQINIIKHTIDSNDNSNKLM